METKLPGEGERAGQRSHIRRGGQGNHCLPSFGQSEGREGGKQRPPVGAPPPQPFLPGEHENQAHRERKVCPEGLRPSSRLSSACLSVGAHQGPTKGEMCSLLMGPGASVLPRVTGKGRALHVATRAVAQGPVRAPGTAQALETLPTARQTTWGEGERTRHVAGAGSPVVRPLN